MTAPWAASTGRYFGSFSVEAGRRSVNSGACLLYTSPRAGIELDEALSPAEKLKVVQARMAEDDSAAADIYSSIGTYLGHTLAYYYDLYACKHVLLLGRVMSGKGGDIVLAEAKMCIRDRYVWVL